MTFRLNILSNFTICNIKYTVAEALPPLEAVSDPPAFLVGAHVHVKPDTRPGIGPEHSVAAYGTIADVKADEGWHYRVKSVHDGRNCLRVPKERY